MTMDKEPEPKSNTQHSPRTKALVFIIGMAIGLAILFVAMQGAMRGAG